MLRDIKRPKALFQDSHNGIVTRIIETLQKTKQQQSFTRLSTFYLDLYRQSTSFRILKDVKDDLPQISSIIEAITR